MDEGSEHGIMQRCRERLANIADVSGLYEFFASNTDGDPKYGSIYLANKDDAVTIVEGKGSGDKGHILFRNTRGATFWICQTQDTNSLKEMARLTLGLNHRGLLKTYFMVYNDQLQRMISACGSASKTLQAWLHDIETQGDLYFTDEQKELVMTLYDCAEYIWEKGYTSDAFSDMNSYRMIDSRIKIRTLVLRHRNADENDFLPVKIQLATLLTNFVGKWPDVEFVDFISFLRDPNSSTNSIHGYPIFLSPPQRQCLYRSFNDCHMNDAQIDELQERVRITTYWAKTIMQEKYFVLDAIYRSKRLIGNDVDQDLKLAHYASAHYVQRLKELTHGIWKQHYSYDVVDRYLKECMPGLLTKTYALMHDPTFQALEGPTTVT